MTGKRFHELDRDERIRVSDEYAVSEQMRGLTEVTGKKKRKKPKPRVRGNLIPKLTIPKTARTPLEILEEHEAIRRLREKKRHE